MHHSSPSALITDKGQRLKLRLEGKIYELTQNELRSVLGLPTGAPGLGISIDDNRLSFEFAADDQAVELTARRLSQLLRKKALAKR